MEAKYYFDRLSAKDAVGSYYIWFRTFNNYIEAMFSIYINSNISSVGKVDVSLNANIYWRYKNSTGSYNSKSFHAINDFHYTISGDTGQKQNLLYSLGPAQNIIDTSYNIIEISIT